VHKEFIIHAQQHDHPRSLWAVRRRLRSFWGRRGCGCPDPAGV